MTEQRYTNGILIERKNIIDEHHQSNAISARGDHEDTENSPSALVFIPKLYMQRYHFVQQQLIKYNVKSVVDFGSAECKIARFLVQIPSLEQLTLVDLNRDTLEFNKGTITPLISDYLFRRQVTLNVKIYQGSITDLDSCILGCDAVTMVEMCTDITASFPYNIKYDGIGDPPENFKHFGYCSQAAIFTRKPCAAICNSSEVAVHNYILVAEAYYPCKETTNLTEDDYMLMEIKYQIRQYIRGQSQTNGEVVTNSEVINGEVTTNSDITANNDVITNSEVTTNTTNNEVITNSEVTTNSKVTTNSEVITNGEVVRNGEVITESQICNVPKESGHQSLKNLHKSDHIISDLGIACHSTERNTGLNSCNNHLNFDLDNVDIQTSCTLSKTNDYSLSDILTPDIQSICDVTFDNQSVCDQIIPDNRSVCDMTFENQPICDQIAVDNQSVCDHITVDSQSVSHIAVVKASFAGYESIGCFVPVVDGTYCKQVDNLVPVSYLMKQKKVLAKFQIDQFREYLQSHDYILSADLDYIVVQEEESLSSDDGDTDDHDSDAGNAFCDVPAPHQEVSNKMLFSETESWD